MILGKLNVPAGFLNKYRYMYQVPGNITHCLAAGFFEVKPLNK